MTKIYWKDGKFYIESDSDQKNFSKNERNSSVTLPPALMPHPTYKDYGFTAEEWAKLQDEMEQRKEVMLSA